jgi:hypothetical protein
VLTLLRLGVPTRIGPHPGFSHLRPGHGFGGFGHHLGSLILHAAMWGAIMHLFRRAPALIWIILLVVVFALIARGISRAANTRWRRRSARITGRW